MTLFCYVMTFNDVMTSYWLWHPDCDVIMLQCYGIMMSLWCHHIMTKWHHYVYDVITYDVKTLHYKTIVNPFLASCIYIMMLWCHYIMTLWWCYVISLCHYVMTSWHCYGIIMIMTWHCYDVIMTSWCNHFMMLRHCDVLMMSCHHNDIIMMLCHHYYDIFMISLGCSGIMML